MTARLWLLQVIWAKCVYDVGELLLSPPQGDSPREDLILRNLLFLKEKLE